MARYITSGAVDHEGEVLEVFATNRRDRKAALKFLKRAMKRYGRPGTIVTDRLRSYSAAMNAIGNAAARTCGRWLNNRAENSHRPFRRREGAMVRFRDIETLQRFASVHASIHNHSHGKWLVKGRIDSLCTWPFSAVIGSKSEPLSTTRPFAEPVKLTSGRRSHRLHQHPAFGGGGSGGRDHSSTRLFQPNGCPVRPPGSGEADRAPRNRIGDIANCQAALTITPSGTTPVVTNFHSPTSSLRARATIMTRLLRPPAALVRS